eukprot:6476419-Amphidinium_carterae.2
MDEPPCESAAQRKTVVAVLGLPMQRTGPCSLPISQASMHLRRQTCTPELRRAVDQTTHVWSDCQSRGTVRRAYRKAIVQQSYYIGHTASGGEWTAERIALQFGGDPTCTACGCSLGSQVHRV